MRSVSRKALEESRDTQYTRACAVRVTAAAVVVIAYGEDLREPSTSESMKGRVFSDFQVFLCRVNSSRQTTMGAGLRVGAKLRGG